MLKTDKQTNKPSNNNKANKQNIKAETKQTNKQNIKTALSTGNVTLTARSGDGEMYVGGHQGDK